MVEQEVTIETVEGEMGTYIVRPDGDGSWPLVIFLMDALGKRELLHSMAARIAERGYYVMLPNLYYRETPAFELDFKSKESLKEMNRLMHGVGNRMAARDTASLIEYADGEATAATGAVGVVGYCMSGPFAVYVAAEHNDRVLAAASFYGARMAVDAEDSPHLRLPDIRGELYVGCAEVDRYFPPEMVDRFEAAMVESSVNGRLERYAGTEHGFAFNDRPAYDAEADARHWDAIFDLFGRRLGPS